jgi:hypothetical protein
MHALLAPLLHISPNGNASLVDVSSVPEIKDAREFEVYDFAIRQPGQILELAGIISTQGDTFMAVIQIDEDDKSASLTRIDAHFSPRQIAPLPSGMFLLAGVQHTTQQGTQGQSRQSSKPFIAIFDSQGKLVRELQLSGDIEIEDVDQTKVQQADLSGIQAVDLSRFIVTDDGTIYLLRNGTRPKVYVISPTGEVTRSFQIESPTEDASAPSIFYANGRLAFDFFVATKDNPRMQPLIRMVDATSGQTLWDYVPAKDIFGIPACYSGRDFTFLSSTVDRRLALLKVAP